MKRTLIAAALGAVILAAPALAQMGPGRMGGNAQQGMGPGSMGQGMGPGMMGQGMGPGMMGPGMGTGMMGQGMGPGMMGQGMGPGMMMGAYGWLDLNEAQRKKMIAIQQDLMAKQWPLMAAMHSHQRGLYDATAGEKRDDASAKAAYEGMSSAHKLMFDNMLEAQKKMDAVLTKEQREQLQKGMPGRMGTR